MIYPAAHYEVWIDTPTGTRLALLDTLQAASLVLAANGIGRWSLTLPLDTDPTLILPHRLVELWRSVGDGPLRLEMAGWVQRIEYSDTNGIDVVKLYGPDGHDLLNTRIVAYAAGSSQASKTDYADDLMKALVRDNLGADATDADRDLTAYGISVGADVSLAPSLPQKMPHKNVLEALQAVADSAAKAGTPLYFGMVPQVLSATQVGWLFETALNQPGADRTYSSASPTVFSKEWGNLEAPFLSIDYGEEVTVVYAGGQGEGADRLVVEVEDTARSGRSPWARRERFLNASNEETTAAVTDRANQALKDGQPRLKFTGQLKDTAQTRYGVDWQFGDRVTVQYAGRQFDGVIEGVRIDVDSSGQETINARIEVDQ